MHLQIKNLYKIFDGFVALDRISLDVGAHDFVCLLGPSGCGKTTLLRIIAGLMPSDGGELLLAGRDLSLIPARDRGFGIVFQSYSLFPNMTVAANIGYGLKIRGTASDAMRNRVGELLDLIKLPHVADRYPHQLSGGQQQRVAIARALAVEPSLLLLDEPLSALDARVRAEIRGEIRDVQRRLGIPTIMVTHDQEEALTLADTVVCMNQGRIEQVGSPQELYARPRTRFVADFVGISTLLPMDWVTEFMPGLAASCPKPLAGQSYELCLRPEAVRLTETPAGRGQVRDVSFLGNLTRMTVAWNGRDIAVETSCWSAPAVGASVEIQVDPRQAGWVLA